MRLFFCVFLTMTVVMGWSNASAKPYVPSDGHLVLETLPSRYDPVQQAFSQLRARLAQNPHDIEAAGKLVRLYVSTSRIDGDPRYLGYAQAVLRPWWNLEHPPETVRLQRAIILQSIHQFPDALKDLDIIVKENPANGQAWLTRATVLTVLGKYPEAKASCARLAGLTYDLVIQTCQDNVGSLAGELRQSYMDLSQAFKLYPNLDPGLRVWTMTLLGEMAARLGQTEQAEAHFRYALTLDTPDGYLLGAFADFLLDRNRPGEVVEMLKSKTRNDALLLRYALALKAQQSRAAGKAIETLRERFAAATMRGDTVHQREKARFELLLLGNAKESLQTALKNWDVQKEPADLRILLECAVAANDARAMKLGMDWIAMSHFEDQSLTTLLQRAKERA